jgi:hypothetical protein
MPVVGQGWGMVSQMPWFRAFQYVTLSSRLNRGLILEERTRNGASGIRSTFPVDCSAHHR